MIYQYRINFKKVGLEEEGLTVPQLFDTIKHLKAMVYEQEGDEPLLGEMPKNITFENILNYSLVKSDKPDVYNVGFLSDSKEWMLQPA